MSDDRTVHAVIRAGAEVVRYDRAGKWFLEGPDWRRPLALRDAVNLALHEGSTIHVGRPGGGRFDAAVRDALLGRTERAA